MFALTESVHVPVVDPTSADGVYSLLWLVVALPLAGAAILLVAATAFAALVPALRASRIDIIDALRTD